MIQSWHRCRLADLCEVASSKRTYAKDHVSKGIPFYRSKEVIELFNGQQELTTEIFITQDCYEAIKEKHGVPSVGDLLLTSRGTLGVPFLVKNTKPFYFADGNLTWFKHLHGLDSRWLFYWFVSPAGKAELKKCVIGSSQQAYTLVLLKDIQLLTPPLATQRKVASILSAYDDLIENNTRRIAVLDEMAKLLYREWFVEFRFPGHEKARFIDSPLGRIPEGWALERLKHVASVNKGLSYKGEFLDDQGTPMVNLKCIAPSGGFRREGTKPYSGPFKPEHGVVAGSLVFANTDLTQAGNIIGSVAQVPNRGFCNGGLATHHICIVRPRDEYGEQFTTFLAMTLSDLRFREFVRSRASGTTVLGVRTADVENYAILVPPRTVLQEYADRQADIHRLTESLEDKNETLRTTRDLLLPKLMSGQVDVEDLDIDIGESLAEADA